MSRRPIERIPSSLGYPFSTAVRFGGVWELSGQVGLDATGTLVPGGVGPETQQAMANIEAVLAQVGSTMAHIIRVGVFLTDMAEFAAMNDVYATFFTSSSYPARSAVAVAALALGAHVEIECTAVAG
jgi:2-iminobutanoate/2-iminopropanoate deaminase